MCSALLGCVLVAAIASATFAPVDQTFQVVQTGTGADSQTGEGPKLAFDQAERVLRRLALQLANTGGYEVYGQRLGPTGAKVGSRLRLEHDDAGNDRGVGNPAVAYSPQSKRYLVL